MGTHTEEIAPTLHQTIVVADLAGFAPRMAQDQRAARQGLLSVLREAYDGAGISWDLCTIEDRGGGAMILAPPAVSTSRLSGLPGRLAMGLRCYNAAHADQTIGLRVGLHTETVRQDGDNTVTRAVHHALQIVDFPEPGSALKISDDALVVIASDTFYREIIEPDSTAVPERYHSTRIQIYRKVDRVRIPAADTLWIRTFDGPFAPTAWTPEISAAEADSDQRGCDPAGADQSEVRDFDRFYLETYRLVRNIVHARAQDWALAEDVANEALAIAYRKWDDLAGHPNPTGFIVITARRVLSKVLRQRATMVLSQRPPPEPQPIRDPRDASVDPADVAVQRTAIFQALQVLPPDQRECFVLHYILDHPIREIAELLQVPENTVKTRLRAARLALRDLLDDTPGEWH
jgi:RNA polymerase sigma factor (sigma-70 family)